MRIFHISDCYAPRTGGIESQVRDLARAQASGGHEVHVLTATLGSDGARGGVVQLDDGVQVHRLGARMPFDLPVNPGGPALVRRLIAVLRPDVVHVHAGVLSPFAYDGARTALTAGAPLAITWHCMLDGAVPALSAAVRHTRWATAPVALSAVSSAAAERVHEAFGAPVATVPNGMDLARWAPSPGTEPGGTPPLRCVATMRLAPRKRAGALVGMIEDAMTQLDPGLLRLDLIGDGPARAALERSVVRRGLQDVVTLRGRLDRDQIAETYRDAQVFLAPAVLEAFGIAALEARAAGLVVVARRGTGIAEFVTHDRDGLLVDDDAAMVRAIVRLARDAELLRRLRREALARRPRFDWSTALAAAEAEYARARTLAGL